MQLLTNALLGQRILSTKTWRIEPLEPDKRNTSLVEDEDETKMNEQGKAHGRNFPH